jgi:hypothetical protein
MGRSPRWWRVSTAAVLVAAMGSWSPARPAYGQVVRAPVPVGGSFGGPLGGVPTVGGTGLAGPGSFDPHLRSGLGGLTGAPTVQPTSINPRAADPTGSSAPSGAPSGAGSVRTPPSSTKAQRATQAALLRVASAIKAIGAQNREGAAIVLKIRRVAP